MRTRHSEHVRAEHDYREPIWASSAARLAVRPFIWRDADMLGGAVNPAGFREVWAVDFEFNGADGERPRPVCMAARERGSGREIRLWRDELLKLCRAPFDTGPDSLFV